MPAARRLPLRFLYLANGIVGSLFTLSLIVLPHVPLTFTIAMLGEYMFQALAYATQVGIVFEVIGANNPLAATIFAFLSAATNVPVTYMMVADGRAIPLLELGECFQRMPRSVLEPAFSREC